MKDEIGNFLADSCNILNRKKSYFSELLNAHGTNDVLQVNINMTEPLVPGLSLFEV
jgi:hypothetical protein